MVLCALTEEEDAASSALLPELRMPLDYYTCALIIAVVAVRQQLGQAVVLMSIEWA